MIVFSILACSVGFVYKNFHSFVCLRTQTSDSERKQLAVCLQELTDYQNILKITRIDQSIKTFDTMTMVHIR